MSHNSSPTPLFSHTSSHTTLLTRLISCNFSHLTHHIQLLWHNSSHTNSSHTTHLPQLTSHIIFHPSPYTTDMIQISSFLSSYTPGFLTHIATHVGLSGPLICLSVGLRFSFPLPFQGLSVLGQVCWCWCFLLPLFFCVPFIVFRPSSFHLIFTFISSPFPFHFHVHFIVRPSAICNKALRQRGVCGTSE